MRQILASMLALLVSMSLLMLATDMFNTFIGLRAVLEGFSKESVGLMMSVFYLGLILGTLRCGRGPSILSPSCWVSPRSSAVCWPLCIR